MRLDGKPLVRRLTIVVLADAPDFPRKSFHILSITDVLDHGIGKDEIERLIRISKVPGVPDYGRVPSPFSPDRSIEHHRIDIDNGDVGGVVNHFPNTRAATDVENLG